MPGERSRECSAPARVALQIVIQAAVHRGPAAGVIGCVERKPQLGIYIIDRVSLQRKKRILVARVVAEKLVIIGKERDTGRPFEGPWLQRLGNAKFGLER